MVAEGAKKLLGTNDLNLHELLIRESAQNSWDARLDVGTPSFDFNVRSLTETQIEILRAAVLTGLESAETDAIELLRTRITTSGDAGLWAIEISDRGTKGLGGPIDSSSAARDGESTDFRDLVFSYGAARDVPNGAGTYGYGKTSSYIASSVSTVVYWTRTWHNGVLQDRLIASAMGQAFNAKGQAFSGRHWWGIEENGEIRPLVGVAAAELGGLLFERHFEGNETGTSILVIDPIRIDKDGAHSETDDGEDEYRNIALIAAEASVEHLWPKMTPESSNGSAPMKITVRLNGERIPVGTPESGLWRIWAITLNEVRRREKQSSQDVTSPVLTQPTWSGHVAYKRTPRDLPAGFRSIATLSMTRSVNLAGDTIADRVFSRLDQRICSMRAPELVVGYHPIETDREFAPYICGVYKVQSNATADNAYAQAENPAHTAWNAKQLDGPQRRIIQQGENVGTAMVKEYIDSFSDPGAIEHERFNQKVSESLDFLRPTDLSSEIGPNLVKSRRGRRKSIKQSVIESIEFVGFTEGGYQRQRLVIRTPKDRDEYRLALSARPIGDGERGYFASHEVVCEWTTAPTVTESDVQLETDQGDSTRVTAPGNVTLHVDVQCPGHYAVDFALIEEM